MRRMLIWSGVALVLIVASWGIVRLAGKPQTAGTGRTPDPIVESDWKKGNPDSKITLIEYADFQCPACAQYYPILNQLFAEYGDRILFVYRHFPLIKIHANAVIAAQAADAAGAQGKFWEMHNLIYENQSAWANLSNSQAADVYSGYASELGLNMEKFNSEMKSSESRERNLKAYNRAIEIGLSATPTFFLNGKFMQPRSYDEFKQLIEDAIKSSV